MVTGGTSDEGRRRGRGLALAVTLALGPGAGHAIVGALPRGLCFGVPSVLGLMLHAASYVAPVPGGRWLWLGVVIAAALLCLADLAWRGPARYEPPSGHALAIHLVALMLTGVLGSVYLRVTAIESFIVPNDAMAPTLLSGDHLFFDKVSASHPERGAIVVFRPTDDAPGAQIARVVGLPGDAVELRAEGLFLNGSQIARCDVGEAEISRDSGAAHVFVERLGAPHLVAYAPDAGDAAARFTVEPGQLFVLGDYRTKAREGRSVPVGSVLGVASLRVERRHPGFASLLEVHPPAALAALSDAIHGCLTSP